MEKSSSIANIAKALSAFQAEMPVLHLDKEVEVKTRTGGSYKFKYASIGNIKENAQPILSKHKLAYSQLVESDGSVTTILMHESGEFLQSNLLIKGESTPQGIGSAITYTKRYSLSSILGLVADEDDDANIAQGNSFETKKKQQQPQETTLYNHKEIGTKEKPLITNESFKKAMALVKEDASIYQKTKNKYTLTPYQDEQLYELAKQTKSKLQTA